VERHQQNRVQCVPQAQFAGGAAVELLLSDVDVDAASPRSCCGCRWSSSRR
jgi:hypothetical protein